MERNGIERDGWIAAAAGLALAALVFLVPFLTYVFSYMITLVHEMGHAFFGWLYGYPSIPAFDFRYGGGVTSHQERVTILALGVQGVLVLAIYVFRHNPVSRALALSICAAYAWTAWTSLHHMVTTAMGHGAELVFAAIFFHRALSGRACQTSAERPLYAFLGFFITFYDVRFAHRLLTSSFHRKLYGQAKGGGHWMDFLARDRRPGVPLPLHRSSHPRLRREPLPPSGVGAGNGASPRRLSPTAGALRLQCRPGSIRPEGHHDDSTRGRAGARGRAHGLRDRSRLSDPNPPARRDGRAR
jgi:hypothetical protein